MVPHLGKRPPIYPMFFREVKSPINRVSSLSDRECETSAYNSKNNNRKASMVTANDDRSNITTSSIIITFDFKKCLRALFGDISFQEDELQAYARMHVCLSSGGDTVVLQEFSGLGNVDNVHLPDSPASAAATATHSFVCVPACNCVLVVPRC